MCIFNTANQAAGSLEGFSVQHISSQVISPGKSGRIPGSFKISNRSLLSSCLSFLNSVNFFKCHQERARVLLKMNTGSMVMSSGSQIHGRKLNDIPAQLLGKYMYLYVMGNFPTCDESKVIPDTAGHGKVIQDAHTWIAQWRRHNDLIREGT